MKTTRSDLDRVQRIAADRRPLWRSLQRGASAGTPRLLEEDMERSPLSEYMSIHLSLTHHRNINPFEDKVWEIYFYKEESFIRSSKFVNQCYDYGYTTLLWVFGTEGQFMPTWHDFEPEFKPRRSRKQPIKRRETKRKLETERRIQHIKKLELKSWNESDRKKEKRSENEIEWARQEKKEEKCRDWGKEQRKNATDLEKEENQNRPTIKNRKDEKKKKKRKRKKETL